MYEFILWFCLTTAPNCPIYDSPVHQVLIWKVADKATCEEAWKESLDKPDPQGMKSYHICKPIEEDL